MKCVLVGVLATHAYVDGVNTLMSVCEYRCPDTHYIPLGLPIPYGDRCRESIIVSKDRRRILG